MMRWVRGFVVCTCESRFGGGGDLADKCIRFESEFEEGVVVFACEVVIIHDANDIVNGGLKLSFKALASIN